MAPVDLRELVQQGRFKADLLDRLSFQVLHLPPLRQREGDILLLANHFARRFAVELGLGWVPYFSPSVASELENYDWPGNVRELKNVVERSVYLSETPEISVITLDPLNSPFASKRTAGNAPAAAKEKSRSARESSGDQFPLDFGAIVRGREVELIRAALETARYQQRGAAKLLGLSYNKFRGLYRKYKERLAKVSA